MKNSRLWILLGLLALLPVASYLVLARRPASAPQPAASPSPSPDQSADFATVRDRMRALVEEEGVPSIAVAVVRGDEVVWAETQGWADVENRIPATVHTPYMLASVSKPITATAVMLLCERGRLDLDRPANEYLGDHQLQGRLTDPSLVTVRRVLQHTSGLPNYSAWFAEGQPDRPQPMGDLITNYGSTMVQPGRFHYSSLAYTLLAELVERADHKPFAAFLQDELFTPLGMSDAYVPTRLDEPRRGAVRYDLEGDPLPPYITSVIPGAEIYASVDDLARFAMLHLKADRRHRQPLLSEQAIEEMQSQVVGIPLHDYRYGLGWSVATDDKGRRHVFHGGGFAGADASLVLVPEAQVAVAVLVNQTRKWPGTAVSQEVAESALAAVLGEERREVELPLDAVASGDQSLPGPLLGVWTGLVYIPERKLPVKLRLSPSGEVTAQVDDGPKVAVREARLVEIDVEGGRSELVMLGQMEGKIRIKEARDCPYQFGWDVSLGGEKLRGVLYASGSCPTHGFLLPYWVELERNDEDRN